MLHQILAVGPLQCNCQIFGDQIEGKALVIDPGDEIPRIEEALSGLGLEVEKIVFTHAHIDHIGRAAELKRSSGAPTYLHPLERPVLASVPQQASWLGMEPSELVEIDHWIEAGETIEFGGARFEVRLTPGHSPGSVSLWIPTENKLIAGDALFRGSIGRTDLAGGDYQMLIDSIRNEIMTLDDSVEVFPGHGPPTTVGRERLTNPFLRGLS